MYDKIARMQLKYWWINLTFESRNLCLWIVNTVLSEGLGMSFFFWLTGLHTDNQPEVMWPLESNSHENSDFDFIPSLVFSCDSIFQSSIAAINWDIIIGNHLNRLFEGRTSKRVRVVAIALATEVNVVLLIHLRADSSGRLWLCCAIVRAAAFGSISPKWTRTQHCYNMCISCRLVTKIFFLL